MRTRMKVMTQNIYRIHLYPVVEKNVNVDMILSMPNNKKKTIYFVKCSFFFHSIFFLDESFGYNFLEIV